MTLSSAFSFRNVLLPAVAVGTVRNKRPVSIEGFPSVPNRATVGRFGNQSRQRHALVL